MCETILFSHRLTVMTPTMLGAVFTPKVWVLGHPGTNGYITSWGMMLSGTAPLPAGERLRPTF